jgi:hypothetical protein
LMSQRSDSRITGVTTRNSALGARAVRVRYTSAASIGDTVPFLDDFQHVPTSMIGISNERWRTNETADGVEVEGRRSRLAIRRYVGLGRGHITEAGSRLSVDQYFKWVEEAEKRLSSRRKSVELFGRYARVFPGIPHDPDPRNILLDLEEARRVYETLDREGLTPHQPLELEDACADCKKEKPGVPRTFQVRGHGKSFEGTLWFDRGSRRYVIESRELAESFHYIGDRPGPDLVSFLNGQQAFSILPETHGVLYADGFLLA